MTLEELLDCSPDVLEKMTDDELLEHFKQYLPVTRPELATKPSKSSSVRRTNEPTGSRERRKAKYDMLSSLAKSMGVDLEFED